MASETSPDGWTRRRLGDCARVNAEQLGARTDPDFVLEYLDIGAIERPGTVGSSRTLRFGDAPSRARRLVREGDILVSTVRPYLRNFGRIRQAPENLVASTGYAVVRPSDDVDGDFLYQHVLSDSFVEFLKPRMSGSNYPAVTAADVVAYPLWLPSLAYQRRLGAILGSFDDAIEKARAIIEQVRVVKRGLMKELLLQVTENWRHVTLEEIATVVGGGTPSRRQSEYWDGGDIPWATPTDVTRLGGRGIGRTASMITGAGLAKSSATLLPSFSLLVTTRATIGACAINEVPMATNQGFQNLVPKEGTSVDFLYYLIQHHIRTLERLGSGSTYLEVPKKVFARLAVSVPPIAEQRRIASVLSSLDNTIQSSEAAIDRYRDLKRTLMSSLLTGEFGISSETA